MILVSLKNTVRRQSRSRVGRWLALALSFTAIGILSRWHRTPTELVRPLSVEERESVISLFEPIDVRLPQIHDWSQGFYHDFNHSRLIPLLDHRLQDDTLARLDGKRILFSPRFFDADSMTQEHWLVQLMAESAPEHASEIAVRPADNGPVGGIE